MQFVKLDFSELIFQKSSTDQQGVRTFTTIIWSGKKIRDQKAVGLKNRVNLKKIVVQMESAIFHMKTHTIQEKSGFYQRGYFYIKYLHIKLYIKPYSFSHSKPRKRHTVFDILLHTPVKSYVVKLPQENRACHCHDDATPLSFHLQVTRVSF